MVKLLVGPVQLTWPFVKVGVTTIVATTGEVPVLAAVIPSFTVKPVAGKLTNPVASRGVEVMSKLTNKLEVSGVVFIYSPKKLSGALY